MRRFNRPHSSFARQSAGAIARRGLPWLLTAIGILFLMVASTVLWWSRDLPDPQSIDNNQGTESTKIFDATGTHLLYEIGQAHRTKVPLSEISKYLRDATLAAEDAQFYQHHGLALRGIVRAILVDLRGGSLQGGSTITQQLIKNSILTSEQTLQRKVKEAVLALELEQRFSKDQIFEMYLNDIPYGNRNYGAEAAAQTYFGVRAADLNVAQAALLAALPKAPTYYSPYGSHFEDLKRRQENILSRMVELNMINQPQAETAKRESLQFQPPRENIQAPHFVFYIKELLEKEYGERVVEQGGLKVITSLDMRLQAIAEDALTQHQERLKKAGAANGALVAIDPKTGNVLAMVGSIDYFNEAIDGNVNVTIRHRSPGSSIKPFVYAAAFQKGYTPDTILMDAATDFGRGYKPKDYDQRERGPISMRLALANSLNIPAVQTLYLAGVRNATELARAMGMDSLNDPDRYGLSLVLGGGEVRLLDETSAYGVFANDGLRHPARAILKVTDHNQTMFDAAEKEDPGQPVLDPQIARLVTNMLSDNPARGLIFGTNSPLQLGSRPVAAKTGTAQEFRDGWTMGYTPSLVAGVWIGNNNNSPMKDHSDGVVVAGPIWNQFMRQALAGTPIEQFVKPAPPDNALPPGILTGSLPEVKGKWVAETNTLYSADCPVAVGQPRTFKELHNLLFYVRRDHPAGPPPANAQDDPQFDNWEQAVRAWRDKHNLEKKDDPNEPLYVDSLPTPACGVQNAEELPKVRITEPNETILRSSPVKVSVEVDSPHPLKEVRFTLDGQDIGHRGPSDPFFAAFSFPANFSGRKTLVVQAITEDNLIGVAHRTFIINPDSAEPAVILHTPPEGAHLAATNFPQTIKATASDSSGIDYVDILYRKDDINGAHRIAQVRDQSPTTPNRYEAIWSDSPGPGTYHIYAVAYDKTGNFAESTTHTVVVE